MTVMGNWTWTTTKKEMVVPVLVVLHCCSGGDQLVLSRAHLTELSSISSVLWRVHLTWLSSISVEEEEEQEVGMKCWKAVLLLRYWYREVIKWRP
uniref:Uncharacterized protein n=1 Tax=Nelumbo nucifera TaxID=4432 RepID=A0A822XUK5_NELNU|nr:TPA_asm: hypothetical protein HUJ06_025135 [Nelumbo nucifera]